MTLYESILDPTLSWLTNLVLHEYNECWLYWSCLQTENEPRIKALWELHLNMEIEHLRVACETMKKVENRDAKEFLPKSGMPEPLTFEPNKEYVREVLARSCDWTTEGASFVDVGSLPTDHRYFDYQKKVNAGGVPSEQVIKEHISQFKRDYRAETEGLHPVAPLREAGAIKDFAYVKAIEKSQRSR